MLPQPAATRAHPGRLVDTGRPAHAADAGVQTADACHNDDDGAWASGCRDALPPGAKK